MTGLFHGPSCCTPVQHPSVGSREKKCAAGEDTAKDEAASIDVDGNRDNVLTLSMVPRGASLVCISGVVLQQGMASRPHAGVNGEYQRSEEMTNGRAVYTKVSAPGTAMWLSNNNGKICWCVGPREHVGKNQMWCYIESAGFGPEEAAGRPWFVHSYNSDSYVLQSGIVVRSLDVQDPNAASPDLSPGQEPVGSPRIVSTGRPLTAAEIEEDQNLFARILRKSVCPQPPPHPAPPIQERLETSEQQRAATSSPFFRGHTNEGEAQQTPSFGPESRRTDSQESDRHASPRDAAQHDRQAGHSSSAATESCAEEIREAARVGPVAESEGTVRGMTYRTGGGFSAVKQRAVKSLGRRAEEDEKIQALMTPSGKLRLPHRKSTKVSNDADALSFDVPGVDLSSAIKAFEFTRVPSNDWLNHRSDLKSIIFKSDDADQDGICEGPERTGIHFLREEEGRVATARSGESSRRPLSSSQGVRGSALDKQVHRFEQEINYLLPKPLLPEVYQQVWSMSTLVDERPKTPRLTIRPPSIPPWNPASPQSPARHLKNNDRVKLPLVPSASPQSHNFRARTPQSPMRLSVGFERGSPERIGSYLGTGPFKHGREAPFANEALENRVHQAKSWQEPAGTPVYSIHQSPGTLLYVKLHITPYQRPNLRLQILDTSKPIRILTKPYCHLNPHIQPQNLQAFSRATRCCLTLVFLHHHHHHHYPARLSRLVTQNPPVGAGFAPLLPTVTVFDPPPLEGSPARTRAPPMYLTHPSHGTARPAQTTCSASSPHASAAHPNTTSGAHYVAPDLALNSTTSFTVNVARESEIQVARVQPVAGTDTLKKYVANRRESTSEKAPEQREMRSHVRASLRPAASYRALEYEYDYEQVARQAAVARARQRQAYQDALLRATQQTAGAVLKDVVYVVCEVMRQRELARLKREAEERARLEQEAFERNSIELVIVRVIQARALPVDLSVLKDGPAPYVWITTEAKDKKRATRKMTLAPSNDTGSFFAALKKAAGAVGLGPTGLGPHKILKEAFTEVGRGVEHVWDEEFTLQVDKVGQRLLRAEAVDDRLKQGKDSLGLADVAIESLPLGKPERNSAGVLYRSVGEQSLQWLELSTRQENHDDEQLEMIVSLVEAKGLAAADKNGTSDPYCTLELDKTQKRKSRTQKGTLDPKWGEAFKFTLGTYDEVMGKQGGISLKGAASAMVAKLHKVDVFSEIAHHGVAALAAVADEEHQRQLEEKKAKEDSIAPAVLHVSVVKAKDLIAADAGGTSDPYVRIHVGREIANGKKTQVVKKSLNPEWNEQFEINIRDKQRGDTLTIEVFDKDAIGKDDSLGKLTIALDSLNLRFAPSGDPLSKWHSFDQEEGIVNKGQILLAYELIKRVSGLQPKSEKEKEYRGITVRVWDYDMGSFGSDDFLGQVVLPLNILMPDETCDRWFDLEARPESRGKDQVKGQIRLKILCRFQGKTSRPSTGQVVEAPGRLCLQLQRVKVLREENPTELSLTLVGSKDLHPRLDTDERPDVLAIASLDGHKLLSERVLALDHPEPMLTSKGNDAETAFMWDILWPQTKLHIALFDKMPNQGRRFLGRLEYDASRVELGKVCEESLELVKGLRQAPDTSASPVVNLQIIVRLLEAKDILAADRGGTSDPYATLEVGQEKFTSQVQKKTLRPKWKEKFRFQLGSYPRSRSEEDKKKNRTLWKKVRKKSRQQNPASKTSKKKEKADSLVSAGRPGSSSTNVTSNTILTTFSEVLKGVQKYLTVSIWDYDYGPNPDDFLGCVIIPMDMVSDGDEFEDWFELRPGQDKAQVSGMVKLGLQVTEKWDPEPVTGSLTIRVEKSYKDVAPEEIVLRVICARDIQAADRGGTSDPFAAVSLQGSAKGKPRLLKTLIMPKTLAPVWDEMFVLVKERGSKNLVVDIFDYDRFGSNDFLGRAMVPVVDITHDEVQGWFPLLEKSGTKASDGSITGEVQLAVRRRAQGSVLPEELDVHVIEAKGLMAADRGGTSDPFAVLGFAGSSRCVNKVKTRVIDKTLNPVWDDRFTLDVEESAKAFVVDVFDDDILGGNDFLGRVSLPMADLVNGQSVQDWYALSSIGDESSEESEELLVEVIAATGIKAADRGGTSDPFASVSYSGGDKRIPPVRTKTIFKNLDPVWNESFITSLESHPDNLLVDIFDYDLVGLNDFLGRVKVPLTSVEPDSTVEGWYELGYKNEPKQIEQDQGKAANLDGGDKQGGGASASAPGAIPGPPQQVEAGARPPDLRSSAVKEEEESEGQDGKGERKAKASGLKILSALSDKMHDMLEKGLDFLRGPEEAISGQVHLRITRRPRDLGSLHLKLTRHNRELYTRTVVTCYARAVSTFAPTVPANLMNARFVSTVVVELVAARNVLAADKAGDSDPYVTFVVEGAADQKKLKSKVVPDNVNPEWNQLFRIPTRGQVGQLRAKVWDHNSVSAHQLLGECHVDLAPLLEVPGKRFDEWWPLTGENKKLGTATGDVRIRVWVELEEIKPPGPPPRKRELRVVAVEAQGLVAADRGGTSDPFAVMQVAGVKARKTKVVKKTLAPKWDETLLLQLPPGNDEPLKVQVYDHDQFGSNDFLGEIVLPLHVLEMGEVVDKWFDLEPRESRDDVVTGAIHLQVTLTELDSD